MTTCLGKSCSFSLPRVSSVNLLSVYVFSYFPFGFEGRMWDLIVSVPDHCLSFYFKVCGSYRKVPRMGRLVELSFRLGHPDFNHIKHLLQKSWDFW